MMRSGTEIEGARLEYLSISRWWRKHSLESSNSKECLWYAENQELLANDMATHPLHYSVLHSGETDWMAFKRRTS